MVLTRSQYEYMSKEELIQELTDINSIFVNDINAKLTDLPERFNVFTSKYDKVYSELQQCKSFNYHHQFLIHGLVFPQTNITMKPHVLHRVTS